MNWVQFVFVVAAVFIFVIIAYRFGKFVARDAVLSVKNKPLSESELREAFRIPEDHNLWQAIMQKLDAYEEQARADAISGMGQEHAYGAACSLGGQDYLRTLRDELVRCRSEAMKGQ